MPQPRLESIKIEGFRPFKEFTADLGPLEVLVGANGAGKSSLFEFLKFLRDGMSYSIPPEIIAGSPVRNVFHLPDSTSFKWSLGMNMPFGATSYGGEVVGPVGRAAVADERVATEETPDLLSMAEKGVYYWAGSDIMTDYRCMETDRKRLTLGAVRTGRLADIAAYVSSWRFYNSFGLASDKIRRPSLVEQEPSLNEDCGNLSAVLHYLMTEHPSAFEKLERLLGRLVPGFRGLKVRAFGAPGEVIAFWEEDGAGTGLVLTDLSDGILRLICWITLCIHPNPPPLICIDEPDQGVHPRTLPVLAALFEKASQRTQILLATHSSYFLSQFDISSIAVMRKETGEAKFVKPKDSAVLMAMLEDFADEIEVLHRSDELERLP